MRNLFIFILIVPGLAKTQSISLSHTKTIYDIAISSHGSMIATAGKDSVVNIYSRLGKPIRAYGGFNHSISDVSFSHDGSQVVAVDYAGFEYTLDISADRVEERRLHDESILDIYALIDYKYYISSGRDLTAKIWTAEWDLKAELIGHEGQVRKSGYSSRNGLITVSDDKKIRIWSLDGTLKVTIESGHSAPIWELTIGPNGNFITGDRDGNIFVWSNSLKLISNWKGHEGPVSGIVKIDQYIISSGFDGNLNIWEANGVLHNTVKGHNDYCSGISISNDKSELISSGGDGMVHIWQMKDLLNNK